MPDEALQVNPATYLKERIAYHRQQARLHIQSANEYKDAVLKLESNAPRTAKAMEAQVIPPGFTEKDLVFSVPVWKPKVEQALKNALMPLKTDEILEEIDKRYLSDEAVRRKAIGIISSSLFALNEKGLIVREVNPDGGKGYLYTWKFDQ